MEELIIELFKAKNIKILLYKDIIKELDLTKKQQLILMSKFKSFKKIEKNYIYNEKQQLMTIVRLKSISINANGSD